MSKNKSAPSKDDAEKAQFSTADRTILAELKHNLSVRDAQFVIKNGKKHHPYSAKRVPYPRNYDRLVLDQEMWEAIFYQQLMGGVSFHTLKTPPAKALDLGCGTGAWILNAARVWKHTHFVGLDIVPLHPDLTRVGSTDLANRVSWIQANFLERLPFPDNEFDFVFTKRICRAVPEDKIDALFEEIVRVMRPGAAIEIAEEDLYFPGSLSNPLTSPDTPSPATDSFPSPIHPRSTTTSTPSPHVAADSKERSPARSASSTPSATHGRSKRLSEPAERFRMNLTSEAVPSSDVLRPSLSTSELTLGRSSRSPLDDVAGPSSAVDARREYDSDGQLQASGSKTSSRHLDVLPSPVSPANTKRLSSTLQPMERKRSLSNTRTRASSGVEEPYTPSQTQHAYSLLHRHKSKTRNALKAKNAEEVFRGYSHSEGMDSDTPASPSQESLDRLTFVTPSAMALPLGFTLGNIGVPSHEPLAASDTGKTKTRSKLEDRLKSLSSALEVSKEVPSVVPTDHVEAESRKSKNLYHPSLGKPLNPRDHSLLERIYVEMHADRFINLTPLAVFTAQLNSYFSRVRTHAPISITFPPERQKRDTSKSAADSWSDDEDDPLLSILNNIDGDASIVHYHHDIGTATPTGPPDTPGRPRKSSCRRSLSQAGDVASQFVLIDNVRSPAVSARRLNPAPKPAPRVYTESVHSTASSETVVSPARSTRSAAHAGLLAAALTNGSAETLAQPAAGLAAAAATATVDTGVKPFSIDLKSLHMHLAIRVAEVLACAEAMWEWVVAEQERYAAEQELERSREEPRGRRAIQKPKDAEMSAIRKMSRSDFDACLSRFEMDMHDKIALDYALEKYLNMTPGPVPGRSIERKSFDAACATWDAGYLSDSELDALLSPSGEAASTSGRSGAPSKTGKDKDKDKDNVSSRSAASDAAGPRQLCRSFRIFAAWKEG